MNPILLTILCFLAASVVINILQYAKSLQIEPLKEEIQKIFAQTISDIRSQEEAKIFLSDF